MDRYIEQLIEDLELAAQNPPKASYVEAPPGFEDKPSIVNLGLLPYKTIEQLSGIKQEAFPEFDDLQGRQWGVVLSAIFKLFESLNIKLIDVPKGMPKEWLYETITSNWKHHVQYLPEEGMDLELCTGDQTDCPYGMFCSCGIDWPDDEEYFELTREIPNEYAKILPQIAKIIDSGLVCIFFGDTLELVTLSQEDYFTPNDPDALVRIINRDDDDMFTLHDRFTIEPLYAYEREQMMEDFASDLRKEPLRGNLFKALVAKNPEDRFNVIVLQSDEKQNWLVFKQNWLEDHVQAIIWQGLRDNGLFPEVINGFFNDDGTRIDPETVPTPSLCMTCKSFYEGDAEEDMLCLLNRNDQRDKPNFECGAYDQI